MNTREVLVALACVAGLLALAITAWGLMLSGL